MGWKALVLAALAAMAIAVPGAAAAPAPGAAPVPLAPAAGQVLRAGGGVTFQVQVPAGAYSVWFAASSSPAVGANGVLASPNLDFGVFSTTGQPGIHSYTTTTLSRVPDQVGTIYWQAYILDSRYDSDSYAEGPVVPLSLVEQRGPADPCLRHLQLARLSTSTPRRCRMASRRRGSRSSCGEARRDGTCAIWVWRATSPAAATGSAWSVASTTAPSRAPSVSRRPSRAPSTGCAGSAVYPAHLNGRQAARLSGVCYLGGGEDGSATFSSR